MSLPSRRGDHGRPTTVLRAHAVRHEEGPCRWFRHRFRLHVRTRAAARHRRRRHGTASRGRGTNRRHHSSASETYGLIGRIYKDLWMEARKANDRWAQQSRLDQAIAAYVSGVERDWRDAYPGINAVTLLDIKGDPESLKRRDELLPVVRFAVRQRFRSAAPEYWDYATLLELAVLASNETEAHRTLGDALTHVREVWEPETTANNLRLIRDARAQRTQPTAWLDEIIE